MSTGLWGQKKNRMMNHPSKNDTTKPSMETENAPTPYTAWCVDGGGNGKMAWNTLPTGARTTRHTSWEWDGWDLTIL